MFESIIVPFDSRGHKFESCIAHWRNRLVEKYFGGVENAEAQRSIRQ